MSDASRAYARDWRWARQEAYIFLISGIYILAELPACGRPDSPHFVSWKVARGFIVYEDGRIHHTPHLVISYSNGTDTNARFSHLNPTPRAFSGERE
jgi:hypothetical protein